MSIEKKPIPNKEITLEEMIAQLPEHVYWKDKNGIMLGSNDNNAHHTGFSCGTDIIGKTDYDFFPKEQAKQLVFNDQEVMRTGLSKIVEELHVCPDGVTEVIYLSHKVPLRNHDGQIIGIAGVSVDVTNARKAEMERLKMLENIIALMPGHVYWVNTDNVYLGCNDNQARSAGLKSKEEIVGKRNKDLPWNFNANSLPETLDQANQEVMKTGMPKVTEEPALLPDGTEAVFLSNKVPLRDAEGNITGMVGISFDITEKKRTEKQLQETQAKLDGMTLMSATIAHELRTPIRAVSASTRTIQDYLPVLLDSYNQAKKAKLPVLADINPIHLKSLNRALGVLDTETKLAFTVIEMLLVRLDQDAVEKQALTVCSIACCINEALARYPFHPGEAEKVHWIKDHHFLFKGNELMVIHILFNLLKNALYFIKAVDKGEIQLWITHNEGKNQLHFKDTGQGIPADKLPYIFDQFFTTTAHGTGIGLSFCKAVMRNYGGDITCHSVEGEYTEFVLSFPPDSSLQLSEG